MLILAGGATILFFVALGARDLWNPNEPIYGRAVVEMAQRGDWTIPTVNGKPFAEKPIGYYWAARASSLFRGSIDELSLRMPSALAGIATVLLTYLLVLPYAGRRRALIAAAVLATTFQVFWASRSVQMDVLVLAATVATIVPLLRMLDFGWRPAPAWALAGAAAGLGFLAKGPVAWVLPALVVLGYAASQRRLRDLFDRSMLLGLGIALAISAPWYVTLALEGELAFLHEVLIRQNFERFVRAWDHERPWWYYLPYLGLDFAPWSLLLPAALLIRGNSPREKQLERLAWIWIAAVVIFFSLSDSKRSPYILPIAPAVAALVAGVVDRWSTRSLPHRLASLTARAGVTAFAIGLAAVGTWAFSERGNLPGDMRNVATGLGVFALGSGAVLLFALLLRETRYAPLALFAIVLAAYLGAALWGLPAADAIKSDRSFGVALRQRAGPGGENVVSYRLWGWRAGYAFYAGRTIPNLSTPAELRSWTRRHGLDYIVVEEEDRPELQVLLPTAKRVLDRRIGSRWVYLFATPSGGPRSAGPTAN
ncbi:MAG: ArnT family glycosyltransferase [Thermoanaerobaculia bacterium]